MENQHPREQLLVVPTALLTRMKYQYSYDPHTEFVYQIPVENWVADTHL